MQKISKYWTKSLVIIIAIAGLVCIRLFEDLLFDDPFLLFFKGNNVHSYLPSFGWISIIFNYFFRYFLNTALSLLIIYAFFSDKKLVQFAGLMYFIFFVTLLFAFLILLKFYDNSLSMIIFYVRRFIIQPVLLLLFIPAFFYQRSLVEKSL